MDKLALGATGSAKVMVSLLLGDNKGLEYVMSEKEPTVIGSGQEFEVTEKASQRHQQDAARWDEGFADGRAGKKVCRQAGFAPPHLFGGE